jgi:hypothetical protein
MSVARAARAPTSPEPVTPPTLARLLGCPDATDGAPANKGDLCMTSLIRDGGAPMWAIVFFGLINLVAALRFAYRPARARLPPIVALALAVLFSIACGVMADIAAVGSKVPARPAWANDPRIHLILLQGLAESMAPGILGFSTLSLVALLCAVGLRRLDRESGTH